MSKYQSYTAYASLWNKSFPSHWSVLPMYALAKEKSICGCVDLPLLSVYLDDGVIPFSAKAEKRTNVTSKDLSKYQRVDCGDFVLNNQQAWRGSVGISFDTGIVSPAYIVLSMNDTLNSRYANYLLRSRIMVDQYLINSKSVGSIQRSIYWTALKRASVPVPPRDEQDQIVRFLDWKVSSINKLINIKKKEIKAIDALKRSIISHVITHGLMPDVPMKYSGVKWLGDIPAHWQTIKLKRVTKVRNEKGIYTPNSEDKYIGLENIKGYSNNISITSSEHDVSVQCICHSGDLMFSKLRPYLAKTVIVPYNCFCTGEMMVISAFNGDMRFLRYVMLHERFIDSVNSSTYGAKMPRANSSYILNMQVPIPQVDEQQKIADYIDEKVLQIDMATKKYEQIIDDLQVLKTRLISDVVTGKIDVRGIEIPEYEFVDEDADADNEDDSEEKTDEQED